MDAVSAAVGGVWSQHQLRVLQNFKTEGRGCFLRSCGPLILFRSPTAARLLFVQQERAHH